MKKISKEKQSQLVLVVVIILLIATGLYMGLIRLQQAKIRNVALEKTRANKKLAQITETIKNSAKIDADLAAIRKELAVREDEMPSDDLYASAINTIRKFKLPYDVDIKQFTSKGTSDLNVFTKFPYKQFTVSIMGSARYHDLGKFIADFENRFPSSRVMNLELLPDASATQNEQLIFRMDIVSLVKSSATVVAKKP